MRYLVCLLECSPFIYKQGNILILDNGIFLVTFLVLLSCHFPILNENYFNLMVGRGKMPWFFFFLIHTFFCFRISWSEAISVAVGTIRIWRVSSFPDVYIWFLMHSSQVEQWLPNRSERHKKPGPQNFQPGEWCWVKWTRELFFCFTDTMNVKI